MIRYVKWMMVGLVGAAMVGCGGGSGDDHTEEPHEVSAEYAGDIASSDVARGQEVFSQVCGACHSDGPPVQGWDAAHMRQQVREGEGRMPPFSEARVSADDLEALLAYMTTVGAVAGELPGGDAAEPASAGDEAPADAVPPAQSETTEG